ncbi:MAG: PAS domain S-box protein [Rhodospirillales bacterium]|nr:PAS domain S-box protein [Rhodospirillales bacterium]
MSLMQTLTAMSRPADGDGLRAAALFVGAKSWIGVTLARCESRLIALAGTVIVLLVAGFTAFVVRQIDQTARKSSEQHVEQLVQAVTYQLGTMMAGIQQTMRYADDEIRESKRPQELVELIAEGQVSIHLLRDLLFIDPEGRVVVSALRPNELASMSNRSDRDYFRIHLDGWTSDAHIGHPMRGRRTGAEVIPVSYPVRQGDGRLMGVLLALIDVAALERIWVDIGFRPEDRLELIGEDDKVWFKWSGPAAGPATADSNTWSRTIAGWPMRVVATLDQATVDRESSDERRAVIVSAAIGSTLVGLFCLLLVRRARQASAGRKAAEAMQARLVASLDAVPVEYIEFDSDKKMIHANRAARLSQKWSSDPHGKTMRELLQDTLRPVRLQYPDTDWDAWLDERIARFDEGGMFEAARANGNFGRFYTVDLPGGGRVVIRVDITESKRRETELAAAQDRYRMLFDANAYPMVVIDRQSRDILAINDAAVAQYGWSREEALTMTSDDFYPPEDLAKVTALRQQDQIRVGVGTITGLRHRTRDGSVIDLELSASKIELAGRPALLTTIQNVTERNRAEKARLAVAEQLRQSQKMEAVGQLTGGIAHDFNNILTVILANADALQEEENLDAAVAGRLDQIGQAVERASGLTRQLLAFSRKQPLSPKRTDINALVTTTGKLLRRALGEQVEIESALADGLWAVNIDRGQLETALVNLCINARDAMPGGGKLRIATSNVTLDEGFVAHSPDVAAGDYAVLSITDTGTGIPPETLTKVFEPFFTTKGVGKGTGLGLSMVYGFIKQSNGHITIDSEVGRGTTFKLHLPRSLCEKEEGTVCQQQPMPGGRERILVAEDDPQVRASVVRQLQRLGYAVSQAPDGAVALAAFEAANQPYDLLLTDVIMPGPLNGKALADEVARRWPKTRVLFMSGYSEDVITHHGRLDAGVRLLNKPFRMTDLATTIREAFDEQGGAGKSSRAVQRAA